MNPTTTSLPVNRPAAACTKCDRSSKAGRLGTSPAETLWLRRRCLRPGRLDLLRGRRGSTELGSSTDSDAVFSVAAGLSSRRAVPPRSQDPPHAATPRTRLALHALAAIRRWHHVRGKPEHVLNNSGPGKQGGGDLDGGAGRPCCLWRGRVGPQGGRYFIYRPYRPPLGLSRTLDRVCAAEIGAERERGPLRFAWRGCCLPPAPSTKHCQRHPRAPHRHRHLRGAAGDTVRFHAVGRPLAPGAAIPSRAPPPGSSFLPSSCRLERVRLHTALE